MYGCDRKFEVSYKACGLFAGILGIIQSIIWIILSIVFIEYCTRRDHYIDDFSNQYWAYFYLRYLRQNEPRPFIMLIIMCIELILSFIWLIASILLIKKILHNRLPYPNPRCTKCIYIFWAVITFLICMVDLFIVGVVIYDNIDELSQRPATYTTAAKTTETQVDTNINTETSDSTIETTTIRTFEGYIIKPVYLIFLLILIRFVIFWIINLINSAIIFAAPFSWEETMFYNDFAGFRDIRRRRRSKYSDCKNLRTNPTCYNPGLNGYLDDAFYGADYYDDNIINGDGEMWNMSEYPYYARPVPDNEAYFVDSRLDKNK